MGIRRRTAVAVSGLVFVGAAAAVTVGAATPASAGGHRSKDFQSVRVFNKNFNFSRSHSAQAQRQRGHQCNDRHHFDHNSRNDGNGSGFAGLGFDGGGFGSCGFGGGFGGGDGGDDD